MKRLLCVFLSIVLLLSLLSGCSAGKSEEPADDGLSGQENMQQQEGNSSALSEQSITLAYYSSEGLNPYKTTDFTNRALFSLVYQSLFIVDREYNVEPMLCKNFKRSNGGKRYTFYLEEATFSDGSKLTNADVVASLKAAQSSTYYKGRFTHVKTIKTGSKGAVVIEMKSEFENLPILLDIPIVKKSQVSIQRPVGTGPYVFEKTKSAVRLRRRDDWWCTAELAITAPSITLIKAADPTEIWNKFHFEDLNIAYADLGSDKYAAFLRDYELWDCENGQFLYLACNMESEVFSNEDLRSSLTYGIDRNTLAQDNYRGFARAASLPASPAFPYYSDALAAKYAYDGEAFAKAVSKAKMRGKKVVLIVNGNSSLRCRVARQLGEMLSDGGLAVEVQELSQSSYKKALQNNEYDLVLAETKLSANMDLTSFFSTSGKLNYGGIGDLSLYGLCLQAMVNHGNYYTLHQRVMDDGRLQPILFKSYAVYTVRDLLQELTPARDNIFFYSLGKTLEQADKTK